MEYRVHCHQDNVDGKVLSDQGFTPQQIENNIQQILTHEEERSRWSKR
jgi:hypothetical protein